MLFQTIIASSQREILVYLFECFSKHFILKGYLQYEHFGDGFIDCRNINSIFMLIDNSCSNNRKYYVVIEGREGYYSAIFPLGVHETIHFLNTF